MSRFVDMTHLLFGRLFVIHQVGKDKHGQALWWCHCSCGNFIEATGYNIRSGRTISCGCAQIDASQQSNTKHGMSSTRLYTTWHSMLERCNRSSHKAYRWYGGRGIKVCLQWEDFSQFKLWAESSGYTDELTIDRIDNDGDYAPGNCQWLSREDNSRKANR